MTKQELLISINNSITTQTQNNTITPTIVGDLMSETVNLTSTQSATTITIGYDNLTGYTGTTNARIVGYINDLSYEKEGDLWIKYTGATIEDVIDPVFNYVQFDTYPSGQMGPQPISGAFFGPGPDPQIGDLIYMDFGGGLVLFHELFPGGTPTFDMQIIPSGIAFTVSSTTSEIIALL